MLKKIKKHAFMIFFGIIFILYFAFLTLIFFAPRVDVQQRGFVACTHQMIANFSVCGKHNVWCAGKVMLKNHACDFRVVTTGLKAWWNGLQKTPWANYYFEPQTEEKQPEIEMDEELQAYYQKHLDMVSEMEALNQKYIELEKQHNQINVQMPVAPELKTEEQKNDKD